MPEVLPHHSTILPERCRNLLEHSRTLNLNSLMFGELEPFKEHIEHFEILKTYNGIFYGVLCISILKIFQVF